jgi:hypothetical protein
VSTSRWLTWNPKGQLIEKPPGPEPPKPSKVYSGGFEGASSELFPIIECPSEPFAEAWSADKDSAASQIFRWVGAQCVRRRDTWSSEKSLWRDYVGWCQQHKQSACPSEQFVAILNQLFRREMDGWHGIALAIDVAASPYIHVSR